MLLVVVSEAWIFLQSFYSTSTTLVTTDHNLLLDDAQHRSHSRPRKRTGEMRGCSSPALRCYWATERMLNWAFFFCGWCPLNSEKKECSTGPILLLPYYGLDRFPSEQHHFKKKSNTKHRLKPSTETHLNEQSNPSQTNKSDGVSRRCGTRSHELIGRLKAHLFIYLLLLLRRSIARLLFRRRGDCKQRRQLAPRLAGEPDDDLRQSQVVDDLGGRNLIAQRAERFQIHLC
jgi:hypothetical protein